MSEFIDVMAESEFDGNPKHIAEVDDQIVVLVKAGDHIYCLDDVCTHDGGPLSDGQLGGTELACPRHGAKFDVRSGEALTMPATQATKSHAVKVEGGRVLVKLADA